jgi:hypothetical protein
MAIHEQQAVLPPSFGCCKAMENLLEPSKSKTIVASAAL